MAPIPVFCLVDWDPYGMDIYGTYKYGGCRRSVVEREWLELPGLKFLGIQGRDFEDGVEGRVKLGEGEKGRLNLCSRDERKIEIMLTREWVQNEPLIKSPPRARDGMEG
jgi:meiotic recombination protein SPO11